MCSMHPVAKKILSLCVDTLQAVRDMAETVKDSVKEAFEEKAEENGQVTGERLKTMFESHQNSMVELIDRKLTELKNELRDSLPVTSVRRQDGSSGGNNDDTMPFADGDEEEVLVTEYTTRTTHSSEVPHLLAWWTILACAKRLCIPNRGTTRHWLENVDLWIVRK